MSNITIDQLVEEFRSCTPDICEHLDTLTQLASECEHITEMGFRHGASFSALLKAKPKTAISYDLSIPENCRALIDQVKGDTQVKLIQGDTLEIEIEETDLLFIDTLHTYAQLKKELLRHGNKAKKYLAFHDTVTFGHIGEDGTEKGLMDAIQEYITTHNPRWAAHEHYENNNGLTILKRIV